MVKINHLRGRRFSVAFALLGVFAAAAVFGVTAAGASSAKNATVRYTANRTGLVTLRVSGTSLPSGIVASDGFIACQGSVDIQPTGACPLHPPSDAGVPAAPTNIPRAHALKLSASGPSITNNFEGIGVLDQRVHTGHRYVPPDQGLCVGLAGPLEGAGVPLGVPATDTVVVEMVNNGWGVFSTSGTALFSDSNANLFSDGNSSGDPECQYDAASSTYFFTEIGAANNAYYTTDLSVLNAGGYSAYNVDTSGGGGYCFPDFPHTGSDKNAFYITINEFCGANQDYAGANIYGISKSQLVAHSATPGAVGFATGVFNFGWRAASGGSSKIEYLLASDQNQATSSDLQVAWVTGDAHLTSGGGPITLSVTSIPSQTYSEPVAAQSTGDDTTCVFNFGSWCSVPEKTLDPIDTRTEQVQLFHGLLYTDLTTSTTVGTDPTVVDGAAWFVVNPTTLHVVNQGIVAAAGTYMVDPSFVSSKWDRNGRDNHLVLSFSMTSPTMNPSTGSTVSVNNGAYFGPVSTTGAGIGPHVSFSTLQPGYLRRRWGDYSAIAIDPATGGVWSADEYIPNTASGHDPKENWGTRIWRISK
jgi:hypothetical protein